MFVSTAKQIFRLLIALLLLPAATVFALEEGGNTMPGIELAKELTLDLQKAYQQKGYSYKPRTEHLHDDGTPIYTNRLIYQDSPYLLQHAHNPVNWYSWGNEALETAKRENKPIFLSIGYSTCHWCHVMERESFENREIAEFLNQNFISIKVDREQRPDLDASYMTAVTLITGRGGWPMSTFLTTDGKPFYGGTYFPPTEFLQILQRIDQLWSEQQEILIDQGERVAKAVNAANSIKGKAGKLGADTISQAIDAMMDRYADLQGGFGSAPKFPNETMLLMLLQSMERQGDEKALNALIHTLDAMYQGGIHDQIGGGFHRYSIDDEWLVPHFEKMLYNQALLGRVYLKGWQLDELPRHAQVTRDILDYVLRDMTSEQGGFFSATDADSEGHEGRFFVWDRQELQDALPENLARLAIELFNVTDSGNFESRNILYLPQLPESYAAENNIPLAQLQQNIRQIREILYQVRDRRPHPARDEKIVTAWNGMMITTLALAGQQLSDSRYTSAAINAAEFIWRHNRRSRGVLYRVHLNGNSSVAASQEDYAWLGEALVALYDVTGNMLWLDRAREIADGMIRQFHDAGLGGFYMSNNETLLAGMGRGKDIDDGAIPSGNSVALRLLTQLATRVPPQIPSGLEASNGGSINYGDLADETMVAFATTVEDSPLNYSWFLAASEERIKGETGQVQYAGQGTVQAKIAARPKSDKGFDNVWELSVTLNMADGWHVNSIEPLQDYLVATTLSVPVQADWVLAEVNYPPSVVRSLGFSREPLSLYEGKVTISATLIQKSAKPLHIPLLLKVQSCSDQVCLAPEELSFSISIAIE